MPDDRTFTIYAKIDEATFHILHTIASERGQMVYDTASELLGKLAETELNEETLGQHPDIRLRRLHQEVRKQKTRVALVREMAFEHLDNPTEESLDALDQAAELAGITLEAILEECERVQPSTLKFKTGNAEPSQVEQWLMATIIPGEIYAAADVKKEGEIRGFKKYAIDMAKREIGIDSERIGMRWYWSMPKSQ